MTSEVLAGLRMRMDVAELEALRTVAALTDAASEEAQAVGEEANGSAERELGPEIERRMRDAAAYFDDFRIRIEDLVVVTADGCERLNDSPRGRRPPDRGNSTLIPPVAPNAAA